MSTGESGCMRVHMKWVGVCVCVSVLSSYMITWRPFGKDKSEGLSPPENPARLGSPCASGNRGGGSMGMRSTTCPSQKL